MTPKDVTRQTPLDELAKLIGDYVEYSPEFLHYQEKQEARQEVKPPAVSLRQAVQQEVVSFSPRRNNQEKEKIKRKEVDVAELRKAIEDSLAKEEDKQPLPAVKKEMDPGLDKASNDGTKKGVINPGQVVKF